MNTVKLKESASVSEMVSVGDHRAHSHNICEVSIKIKLGGHSFLGTVDIGEFQSAMEVAVRDVVSVAINQSKEEDFILVGTKLQDKVTGMLTNTYSKRV